LALEDQPPVPFRVPPGIKLVRVNLKTGLPTGANDPTAILEAFKPNEGPAVDATATNETVPAPETTPEEASGQASLENANTSAPALEQRVQPAPPPRPSATGTQNSFRPGAF
jgi:membrane carboxypeptidase/penicillin-binding protein